MNDRIELVHALVDGELDAEQRDQVTSWVSADPELLREYHWALAMKDLVANKCSRIDSPASWEAAQKRLREIDRAKTVNFLVGKHAWGLCGVLVVAVLAAGLVNKLQRSTTVSAVSAAEMIRTPWSSPASTANNVQAPVPYVFADPTDGSELFHPYMGLQVVGPLSSRSEGRAIVQFGLVDKEGPMTLSAINGATSIEGVNEKVGYSDYNIGFINSRPSISWEKGKKTMLLTADRSWDKLVELAKKLR